MRKIVIFVITFFILLAPMQTFYAETCKLECEGEGATRTTCNVCKEEAAKAEIKRIENEIATKSKNQDEAKALAIEYGGRIDALNAEIDALLPEIEELQIRIDQLVADIETNTARVEEINKRVLNRMANAQTTMHYNPMLDFLLGSSGFSDFLRRTYGLEAITGKEDDDKNELIAIINQLNSDKDECDNAKYELESKKKEMESKKQEAQLLKNFYDEQVKTINAEIDALMSQEAEQQMILSSLVYNIEDLLAMPKQTGFVKAVPAASISAGFPYYPASFGGGVHTGVDYAAPYGTPIYAPADGVIISSVNTCSLDTGNHLGNNCGGVTGKGIAYGGNQIRMIVSVNGNVYALIFFHMAQKDVHAEGVVTSGTMIGRVGSSGNSTGCHCHIELIYLGKGENADIPSYLNKGYTLGFNLSFYSTSSICAQKGGAPCKLDSRSYFGADPANLTW